MGPYIVLDKSAFQSLSYDELLFLSKHYSIVLTPVLVMEILGDLKKQYGERDSGEIVKTLARKIIGIDTFVNVDYRQLCIANLMGHRVPMQFAPVIHGEELFTEEGEPFNFIDEPAEMKAIRNWKVGNFSKAEMELADQWRLITRSFDLEGFRNTFRKLEFIPKVKTVEELLVFLNRTYTKNFKDTNYQKECIFYFLDDLAATDTLKEKVYARWYAKRLPPFYIFAPYAHYCFMLNQIFKLGVIRGLITTRSTNRVDMEYLFYTPFAMAFSSDDNFHKALWPHVIRPEQFFIPKDELKADLSALKAEWDFLSPVEKQQRDYDYGCRPPQNPISITHRVWDKHMRPWKRGSGNLVAALTEDEKAEIVAQTRPITQAIETYDRKSEHSG